MNLNLSLRVWRNAVGAHQMRMMQGPRLPTLSEARRLAKETMGPHARIWRGADGFSLGYDQRPGRTVLSRGTTLHGCLISFLGSMLPEAKPAAESAEPAPVTASAP